MLSVLGLLPHMCFVTLFVSSAKTFKKPLDPNEEKEYLLRYKNGDNEAKNILIERNLRLVAHIVKKYSEKDAETDDLISIGTIGLIKAINTFNPSKNVKLSGYIGRIVYQEIITYISEKSKSFRYSPKNFKNIIKIKNFTENDHTINDKNIAKLLNINLETVKILKMNIKNPTSINELIKINNDSFIEKIDTIQDNSVDAVDEQVIKSIENERLIRYLNYLDKRTINMIKLYYGFYEKDLTLQEIGNLYNLHKERVRQIIKNGLDTLKNMYYYDEIKDNFKRQLKK